MLNSSLQSTINGKADSSSLGDLAKLDKVEEAQLGTTLISGGYIRTELINTDAIFARMAKIGGFTIDNGRLWWKASDYFGGDSRSLKLGASSNSADGMVDVTFTASTNGRFGVKASGRAPNSAAIYGSDSYTPTYPTGDTSWAGYFDGSVMFDESTGGYGAIQMKGLPGRTSDDLRFSGQVRIHQSDGINFLVLV